MKTSVSIHDLRKSACAKLNPHLFSPEFDTVKIPTKGSKHRSKKVVVNGIKYDSIHESKIGAMLIIRERIGEITELKRQVPFQLSVCKYYADFTYYENGKYCVADAKSVHTRTLKPYRLKKKMMLKELNISIIEL